MVSAFSHLKPDILYNVIVVSGNVVRLNSLVSHCIFPSTGRNYTSYLISSSVARKIPAIYHDIGNVIHLGHSMCT